MIRPRLLKNPLPILATIVTVLLLSACQSTGTTIAAPKQALNSPPAGVVELTIESNGNRMPGIAYLAAGNGPHPTVLLLHGYPGNEKNLDVAQALRRAGWNVVFFHYRGAWGAEGEFSFRNAEQDVQVVLDYLRKPESVKKLRIDPQRISTVGHSMGGHMAIAGILEDPNVKCAVAYDGANMGLRGNGLFSDPASTKLWRDYSDTLYMLNGWSGAKAIEEISKHGAELDLLSRTEQINNRPVFLISADTEVIPEDIHIKPLLDSLNLSSSNSASYTLIDDDHSFSSSRLELIAATEEFLNKNCR